MTDYEIVMNFIHRKAEICNKQKSCKDCKLIDCCTTEETTSMTKEQYNDIMSFDWSVVKVDTKILVSNDGKDWLHRYFAKYENGNIYAWESGLTSWTAHNIYAVENWEYAKVAEGT